MTLRNGIKLPTGAIESLRGDQRQLDEDGVFVSVSRQAVDEVLAYIDTIAAALNAPSVGVQEGLKPNDQTRAQIAAVIFHHIADGQEVTEKQRQELLEYLGLAAAPAASPATPRMEIEDMNYGTQKDNLIPVEPANPGEGAVAWRFYDQIMGKWHLTVDAKVAEIWRAIDRRNVEPLYAAPAQGDDLRRGELEKALREARTDIIRLAESGTARILDLGGSCDPAERTYAPAVARIDAALSPQSLSDKGSG